MNQFISKHVDACGVKQILGLGYHVVGSSCCPCYSLVANKHLKPYFVYNTSDTILMWKTQTNNEVGGKGPCLKFENLCNVTNETIRTRALNCFKELSSISTCT
jgi:hypothetical protein